MAMQIPRSVYPEVPAQEALWSRATGTGAGVPPVGGTERVCDRGGAHIARSRAHASEYSTEAGSIQRGGILEGQECHPRGAACLEAGTQLCRPAPVGEGVFRRYGGAGHRNDPALYPGARGRGSPARPA